MRIDLTGTEQEQRKSPARSSPPVPLVVAVRKSHPVASALFCCGCCRVHKDYDYRSVTRSDKNRRTKEQDEQDGVPDVRQGRQDNHLGRIKIEKETTISSSSSFHSSSYSYLQHGYHPPPPPSILPPTPTFEGESRVLQGMFNILQKYFINLHLKSKYVNWSSLKICLAFGFCEYSNPDAALRSIRLLHELEIGEKNLVVKVDAKTKLILDTYKGKIVFQYILKNFINLLYVLSADKIKAAGGGSTNGDDEFLTQEQRVQDKWVKERIGQTLKDYESEMQANQARGNIDFNEFNALINVVTWISISLQPRKRKEKNKKK